MSPLSELVWSPDEGLSIKIAASSLSTRKASLRWNADTLNIVISSPQQSGAAAKSGDNVDANTGVSEKMPSQLQTCSGSSVRITMASPNNIANLDALQSTSMRSQEQDPRINVMNEGKEVSENCCEDNLDEVEANSCPTRCCKDTPHSSDSKKEVMPSILENQVRSATTACNERSRAANAWRARLLEAVSQNTSILPKKAEKATPTSSLGDLRDAGKVPGRLADFVCRRNVQYPGNDSKDVTHIIEFHPHDRHQDQVLQEGHKDEHVVEREESGSGVNAVARCESASGINTRRIEKGKEKVIYNDSNCVSNTKESDDSNETIESCPSTKAPKRKHMECSAANMSSRNKRYRREDNKSSCSGILQQCGSSFFNWMSSLTKGLVTLDETTAVPLDQLCAATTVEESAAAPLPLQSYSGIPVQPLGFNSLFQSLYNHNAMINSRNICHQPESKRTEHVPNGTTLDLNDINSVLDKQNVLGRDVTTGTLAADSPQMVSGASRGTFQNQFSIPMREERYVKLPNSCSRSAEEKQYERPAGCSNTATGNRAGAKSLWVSRFLPKMSMRWMDVTPCDLESDVCAVNPMGVDNNLHCSSLQNFNVEKEVNDAQCFTGKGSSDGATSRKHPAMPPEEPKQLHCSSLQNFNVEKEVNDTQCFTGKGSSDGATSSKHPAMPPEEPKQLHCSSLQNFNVEKEVNDAQCFTGKGSSDEATSSKHPAMPPEEPKKLHCSSLQNFNVEKEVNDAQCFTGKGSSDGATSSKHPAMPPEEPKQSETMASVFAKRLGALRHATTSAVQLAFTSEHGIHRQNHHRTTSFVISDSSHNELEMGQDTHKPSSGNGKIVSWTGDKGKEQQCAGINEESKGTFGSKREHQHVGASTAGKSAIPHDIFKTNTSGEDIDTTRVEIREGTSDFMAIPNNKQIVIYGSVSNVLVDESSVVCGALQRLRLSRSDIIRWLRSPVMHTSLDGFFVRLRFGKWEEALGGTGYHVARLNGALDRNRLSVTIRKSTCQVDSRFVSNHDFHEDELNAWWSAAMKGGWKLPSKQELDTKLRERELFRR